jgi:uncharacterized protein YjbJ (UPF0337 family)
MNWDQIQGRWTQLKGKAREAWGDITDDEWDRVDGKRDQLIGLIQKKYGDEKADAERKVDDWMRRM